jgi:hypothetical protein
VTLDNNVIVQVLRHENYSDRPRSLRPSLNRGEF